MAAFCRRCKTSYILVSVFLILIFGLHFYLLPVVSGAYNNKCYLSSEQLNDLRYAVQTIARTMEKHNTTYWLDYGKMNLNAGTAHTNAYLPTVHCVPHLSFGLSYLFFN